MLSSQTKDEITSAAIQYLRARFGGRLTQNAVWKRRKGVSHKLFVGSDIEDKWLGEFQFL